MYSESTLEEINNLFRLPGEKDFCQCVSYGPLESARLELDTVISISVKIFGQRTKG